MSCKRSSLCGAEQSPSKRRRLHTRGLGRLHTRGLGKQSSVKGLGKQSSVKGLGKQSSAKGLGKQSSAKGLGKQSSVKGLGKQSSVKGLGRLHTRGLGKQSSVKGLENKPITRAVIKEVKLHSAYLGEVSVSVCDMGDETYMLKTVMPGPVTVMCVDTSAYGLTPNSRNYDVRDLAQLPATIVSKKQCYDNYQIIASISKKLGRTPLEKSQLSKAYVYNCAVDVHFNTCQYLDYTRANFKLDNVVPSNTMVSLHNVKRLDNAYFTGEYMVYGNGSSTFCPLTTVDITGHELGHSIVQSTCGLEYRGHSGALNESFADIFGSTFEFYLYNKFNENADTLDDIKGSPNWEIGEMCGKSIPFLRNMADPEQCEIPQPKTFKGRYWADPNSSEDGGGVHTNSGVSNYCFYLIASKVGVQLALKIFYDCLLKLNKDASYIDYRDTLMNSGTKFGCRDICSETLDKVGLVGSVVSDWLVR
jgi:hypothetical protein